MEMAVSSPGTVNVAERWVPQAKAQALFVSVVTLIFMSSLSGSGPTSVVLASTAPLPLAPDVSTPEKRLAMAEAGLVLPVTVTVI